MHCQSFLKGNYTLEYDSKLHKWLPDHMFPDMGLYISFVNMLYLLDNQYSIRTLVCNPCTDLLGIQANKYRFHLYTEHLDHKEMGYMDHHGLVL